MQRQINLCEEMKKLRAYLDDHNVSWEDTSSIKSDEEIERLLSLSIPKAYSDTSIYRTQFEYEGITYSVINGYGTSGGYRPSTQKNEGLLEMLDWSTEKVSGGYTADEVIQILFKKEEK